jgi:hypothetical protein
VSHPAEWSSTRSTAAWERSSKYLECAEQTLAWLDHVKIEDDRGRVTWRLSESAPEGHPNRRVSQRDVVFTLLQYLRDKPAVNMAFDYGQTGVVITLSELAKHVQDEEILDAARKVADFVVAHAVRTEHGWKFWGGDDGGWRVHSQMVSRRDVCNGFRVHGLGQIEC